MVINNGKAYLIQCRPLIHIFDLTTETWTRVGTRTKGNVQWTDYFPSNQIQHFVAEVYKDTVYVFGGSCPASKIGRNTLMALDLRTMEWRLVSGTVHLKADITLPGVREDASSWLIGKTMYVAFGTANRAAAYINDQSQGSAADHPYGDLWSCDLETETWTQEKFSGNGPSLRSEVGCAYNTKWNSVVAFGGYTSTLIFKPSDTSFILPYTYWADTFVWSADTRSWKHVICQDFPTYRAMADVFVDQDTGRTYLFGGCKFYIAPSSSTSLTLM